ncbi:hypothetical protein [Roseivivax sediminis]|uniref:Uncharacterized protein n=1 Tax=Roseivivax sediminis TaxID=936889 RepID=A0A1I1T3P6_9RHOB|nr:hypothetical protein [Roseivivax sediminis]SFD51718.1 hypothetical protein SAMN04515678_101405 [Roseivivax sediminis]
MHDLLLDQERPLVYNAMLAAPGSKGIIGMTGCIVPQFSGMSFVKFHYPPGEFSGMSFGCWLIGIVRTPHLVKHSEFQEKCTRGRTVTAGELLIVEPGAEYSSTISMRAQIDFLVLTKDRLHSAMDAQHANRPVKNTSPESYFASHLIAPLVDAVLSSAERPDVFEACHSDNFINAIVSGLSQPEPDMSAGRDRFHNGLSPRDLRVIDEFIDNAAGHDASFDRRDRLQLRVSLAEPHDRRVPLPRRRHARGRSESRSGRMTQRYRAECQDSRGRTGPTPGVTPVEQLGCRDLTTPGTKSGIFHPARGAEQQVFQRQRMRRHDLSHDRDLQETAAAW